MAAVYILYSKEIDTFYIGSCFNLKNRIEEHNNKKFKNAFTTRANDWTLFYSMESLNEASARNIEKHIKKMKSRTYIQNLKRYPEIAHKLIEKFSV